MNSLSNVFAWLLIIVGALITFLVKPILAKNQEELDESSQEKQNKIIYITKIIGMWLVIIGAAMIFIAGGMYGRH
ncbi:MAG: hypothetical protein II978_08140 [Clostridia bacterium]|nr:hypothetical protein [Clostridia bacterium]